MLERGELLLASLKLGAEPRLEDKVVVSEGLGADCGVAVIRGRVACGGRAAVSTADCAR